MENNDVKYVEGIGSVPRVTAVLKVLSKGKYFEAWLKKNAQQADEILSKAGDIGTGLHNILEKIGNGEPVPVLEGLQNEWVAQFMVWKSENVKRFISAERPVLNKTHLYCGTLDALVELNDGTVVILDYKTGKYFYDTFDLQVAAYAHCLETPPKKAIILRFDKETGKMHVKEVKDLEYEFDVFLCALRLWYWKLKKEGKNDSQ